MRIIAPSKDEVIEALRESSSLTEIYERFGVSDEQIDAEERGVQWFLVLPSADGVDLPRSKVVGPFSSWSEAGAYNTTQALRGEIHFAITPEEYEGHLEAWS